MANTAGNVRVAVSGKVWVGATSATPPTGTADTLTGGSWTDLGYVDEAGVVLAFPGEGDKTVLRAWQNGDAVRTLRTPSEDVPTFTINFIESTLAVVKTVLGVSVTQTGTEGSFEYKVGDRDAVSIVVDVIDGDDLMRLYVPQAKVTEVADVELVSTDMIRFGGTFAADLDSSKGYNFKAWSTDLSS